MPDVLSEILDAKRAEVSAARALVPRPDTLVAPVRAALAIDGFAIVAEVKRASPSAGRIDADVDAVAQATRYAGAGAAAVSVLTDARWFGGSLDDLRDVRAAVDKPVLRKDFVVDRYQIDEARAAGADLVLLIAAALADDDLVAFARHAAGLGMTTLVEVHDPLELDAALDAVDVSGGILGVNARNLATLEVDLASWDRIAELVPAGVVRIAESGVRTPADAARAAASGYHGVLVGEALMRASDPGAFVAGMVEAAAKAGAVL